MAGDYRPPTEELPAPAEKAGLVPPRRGSDQMISEERSVSQGFGYQQT